MPSIGEWLFGGGDRLEKIDNFSPEQKSAYQQIMNSLFGGADGQGGAYGQSMKNLMDLLDPSSDAYERMSAPYMRQFNEEIIPGLAEQYAGLSPMGGALSSSGFGQALGSAAGGLQERLAALRQQGMQQAGQQIQQQGNQAMQYQPFQYRQTQGGAGILPSLLSGLTGSLGQAGFGSLGGFANQIGGMFR